MDVNIHQVHVTLTNSQKELLARKLEKLRKFRDYIQAVDLYVKATHTRRDDFSRELEMKVLVPGKTIVVRERARSFEDGIDKVIQTTLRQLRRLKERRLP